MSGRVPPSSQAGKRGRKSNPAFSAETKAAADLYRRFTGHEPEAIGKINIRPLPKSAACIGVCDGILYTTVRDGRVEKYIHKFKVSDAPLFCVSPDGTQLLLIGGAYDFTERGIVDRTSKK
ncbi:MAG: hypothetical protein ACOYBQ_10280 [Fluviibacter sp.]